MIANSGSMASVQITTAVAWLWEPRHRASYRGRPLFWVLVAAGTGVGLLESVWGWALAGTAVFWLVASMMQLRRRVTTALGLTTVGSRG